MRDSMDGMYDNNFYFNNPVDYMASEHDPWFFHRSSCSCYTWFTYSDKGGDLGWVKVASASNRWRTWLSTWSAAPLRACPRRSTWPTTGRQGRSWARETPKGFASGAAAQSSAPRSP